MIGKVSLRNFKSLRDVHFDLERLTVFVGPNASGKSSILQGLNLLNRAFRFPGPHVEDTLTAARSRGSQAPVELAEEIAGHWYRYRSLSGESSNKPARERKGTWSGDGRGQMPDPSNGEWIEWKFLPNGEAPLPLSVLLRLEASKLIDAKPRPPDPATMSPEGTNLHSALASMALNDPDTWQQLQADLRRIIPTIRRLRYTKTSANQHTSLIFDTVGADSLSANQVSEGTLLVLGMLAAIYASERPNLVLFDDLDRGLHPKAQKELILFLRGLLDMNPGLQIAATTHSPYMLDCVKANEVRMTVLQNDATTVCAPLTSHPRFPKWKDEMAPGEMWSLFGEKWLIEDVTP